MRSAFEDDKTKRPNNSIVVNVVCEGYGIHGAVRGRNRKTHWWLARLYGRREAGTGTSRSVMRYRMEHRVTGGL